MILFRTYSMIIIGVLSLSGKAWAQQGDFWAFGEYDGINFKTYPPAFVRTALYESFDCATACDNGGNLLFYTDANNIYNRDHKIMLNGDSIIGNDASQGCLILQSLTKNNQYYVFSTRSSYPPYYYNNDPLMGFYYSIVDMNGDNGLGNVIQKNTCLAHGYFTSACPVRHANGRDIWIVTKHYPDSFYTYLFTTSGISNCVKSFRQNPDMNTDSFDEVAGKLRISNDRECLAETYNAAHVNGSDVREYSYFNLYDFDNSTGLVSHQRKIIDLESYAGSAPARHDIYDAAFSPNDSFVYVTGPPYSGELFQYERFASNVPATLYQIIYKDPFGNNVQDEGLALQLAPNGFIYTGGGTSGFIGVITHPDRKGAACGFQYYLPKFLFNFPLYFSFGNFFLEYKRVKFNLDPSCDGYIYTQNLSDTSVFKNFRWYFGADSADGLNIKFQLPKTGEYEVRLRAQTPAGFTGWYSDSFYYVKPPIAHYTYQTQAGCQYVGFHFKQDCSYDTLLPGFTPIYLWLFGDGTSGTSPNPVHVYNKAGNYKISLIFSNGICIDTFTSLQQVTILPAPKPGFSVSDTAGCVPLSVNVADEGQGSVVSWLYVVKKIPLPSRMGGIDSLKKGDSLRTSSFPYSFAVPGDYIIHQYLTGTTGCVTEDSQMVYATPVFSASDSANMDYVTVDSGNAIGVKWATYPGALRYGLYRYTDNNMGASLLAAQTSDTSYIDNNGLNPNQHSYTYYVQGQDGCGHATSAGRLGKSIKLGGFEDNDLLPELVWNRYAQWQSGVKTYHVYRENSNGSYTFLGDTKDTFYTDEGFANNETYGACYKVEAVSADSQYSSTSNIYCFSSGPQIYIPDIFTPNGDTLNDVFAPVCMGIKQYTMTIINRWGEKVYNSDEASPRPSPKGEGGGWDGSFKGNSAPQGIYVYYIKALDYNGNTIIRKGMVVLGE